MREENRPLTAIRGFAALWVVFHHWVADALGHAPTAIGMGYTAVDLFFILSGLILAEVYQRLRWRDTGRFLLKRACRVYPLHVMALFGLIVAANWPGWHARLAQNLAEVLHGPHHRLFVALAVAALGWAVWRGLLTWRALLAGMAVGLALVVAHDLAWSWRLALSFLLMQSFLPLNTLANPPAWSAGVEILLYVAFPFAIMALRRNWPAWLPPICVAALLLAEYQVQGLCAGNTSGAGAVARGACGFLLGMALWRTAWDRPAGAGAATLAELAGLGGFCAGVALSRPGLIAQSGAILLYGLSFDRGWVARTMRAAWCVWLGRISFSIYLVHYPLWVGAVYFLPPAWFGGPAGLGLRMIVLLAILLPLCTLTWTVIEEPWRKLPDLFRPRRRWALASAAE